MAQKDLRTYRRRDVTRKSGYHTCDDSTGGECLIRHSELYITDKDQVCFIFYRDSLELTELFNKSLALIAFGGYIFTEEDLRVSFCIKYDYEGEHHVFFKEMSKSIEKGTWGPVGVHIEQNLNRSSEIHDVYVEMTLLSKVGNRLEFISFDFDSVNKEEFQNDSCAASFYKKTNMHVPYLYYLQTLLPFSQYMINPPVFQSGRTVVMKSCNRCGRFLPINEDDEIRSLSFSLHCKKRAPCVHSTFRAYKIQNYDELSSADLSKYDIEDGKVISYYGHQLECKACKKFFVNAPLNPQRNAQQFKEDGLRRRAIEVLVNELLDTNLIHFEFERRTKKEFSEYIWKKFDQRCFKCGPNSKQIKLKDMALDHTMPLAYLYRLDESATCLCSSHNSQKRDHFPVDYYNEQELLRLEEITGLSYEMLHSKSVNETVLNLLINNVVWFYDDFLMSEDYQKIRDGICTADKINDSLKRVIADKADLAEEYRKQTGHYPKSVTIK